MKHTSYFKIPRTTGEWDRTQAREGHGNENENELFSIDFMFTIIGIRRYFLFKDFYTIQTRNVKLCFHNSTSKVVSYSLKEFENLSNRVTLIQFF